MRNVIDSSVWIETLVRGGIEKEVLAVVRGESFVPTVVILEVTKWLRRHLSEDEVGEYAVMMGQKNVVPLSLELALAASAAGVEHKLSLGDSIIYATAQMCEATLWTMDAHFEGLPGVRMVKGVPG